MNSKNEDILKRFHESLENMKGNIHIIESQIDVDIQMKFYSYSNNLKEESNHADLEREEELLFSPETSLEEKKHSLAMISNIPDVKAFRLIEKYTAESDPELKDWGALSLLKSRITLETDLSDEKQMVISTGLGGKDNKLRFFILILSEGKEAFSDFQKKTIQKEFSYFLEKSDCETEEFVIRDNYFTLLILVPIMADLQEIFDAPLNECNQYGNFLNRDYIITNVRKIPTEEINELLTKMK
ncbi:MAG: hypothetical protein FWF54_11530 [Candidatus Azobacteroides sp.]|nr:hypothetical protein [Candidatus Azobacteroides sp.]